jgi:hypothetical protein
MSAGHGGQILLSQESADLCKRNLPSGVYFKDLGEQRVKGMLLPEHFYQVAAPDLPENFPPLRTQAGPRHNLSIYTRKCSTHIQPHRASDLRQQCTTFVRGLCANQVDC